MTKQVTLLVNGNPIPLDYFVEAFIDHVTGAIIEALEDTAPIKNLALTIEGEQVSIVLNEQRVRVNVFAAKIIKSTIVGMISVLKGVRDIQMVQVNLSR